MLLQKYTDQYLARTAKSDSMWQEAKNMLPGGVAGGAGFLAPRPIYLEKAQGGRLYDVDGNEYIDLLLGGFLNILGHSPKVVVDAVTKQLELGTAYMLFQETGLELVRKIQKHQPHIERIRFGNSGSEATMFAIRTARAFTGREKIAKPEGGYNGQHEAVLMSATSKTGGSKTRPEAQPESAGMPSYFRKNTVVFPWNDIDATVSIIEENAAELAAVILEPLPGFGMGTLSPEPGYLEAVREVTEKHGILLIFDEIAIGFRIGGLGGASAFFGVTPDLSCYGKVIGGGFPVGAFGGRADVMEKTLNPGADPQFKVFQSGSFTGNAVTMAAGLACLTELENLDYGHINGPAAKFSGGLAAAAERNGFPIQVTNSGSIFYPHFNEKPLRNMRDKIRDNFELNKTYCMGMVANGVYMPPAHAAATCFAHTDTDIDYMLDTSEKILSEMKNEGM